MREERGDAPERQVKKSRSLLSVISLANDQRLIHVVCGVASEKERYQKYAKGGMWFSTM